MLYNRWRRLRDVVLAILIGLSFLFTFRLWYGVSVHNLFVFLSMSNIGEQADAEEFKIYPQKIIVNRGNSDYDVLERGYKNSDAYNKVYSAYNKTLKKIMATSGSFQEVYNYDSKLWDKYADKMTIDIKYGCNISSQLFEHIFRIRPDDKLKTINEVIIAPDFARESINGYVYDGQKQQILKYHMNIKNDSLKEYLQVLKYYILRDNEHISYTKIMQDKKIKQDLFVPYVNNKNKYRVYNMVMRNQFTVGSKYDEDEMIKDYFRNSLVVRERQSIKGVRTFFDSERSLDLYKSGYMEYSYYGSLGKDQGITQAYNEAIKIIKKRPGGMPAETYISSVKDYGNGKYFFAFDYKVFGIPVKIPSSEYTKHAVEVTVDHGEVITYKRFAKEITPIKPYYIQKDPLKVIEKQVKRVRLDSDYKELNDFDLCYRMNKKDDEEVMPFWYIQINRNGYFIPVKEE